MKQKNTELIFLTSIACVSEPLKQRIPLCHRPPLFKKTKIFKKHIIEPRCYAG